MALSAICNSLKNKSCFNAGLVTSETTWSVVGATSHSGVEVSDVGTIAELYVQLCPIQVYICRQEEV